MPTRLRIAALLAIAAAATWWLGQSPGNDRNWVPEQARLASAEFAGNLVTIRNVRNFRHTTCGDSLVTTPSWEDRRYDLADLTSLWYVLSPFGSDFRGPAHAMLSFGFADTAFVAISVEARKEVGEAYSIWRGLLRRYELMYVVADERDVIALRANAWNDDVYVYPIRATPAKVRTVFVAMLERANELIARPEFYDTVRKNCTTTLLDHADRIADRKIPSGYRILLPGYSDELLHELGLMRSEETLEAARARFRVNERAREFDARPDFSRRIREAPL